CRQPGAAAGDLETPVRRGCQRGDLAAGRRRQCVAVCVQRTVYRHLQYRGAAGGGGVEFLRGGDGDLFSAAAYLTASCEFDAKKSGARPDFFAFVASCYLRGTALIFSSR